MAEDVDPVRSRIMRAIKGRDTSLEMKIRRRLHALGYRYFVHGKGLPGRPDIVFPRRRKEVFLNGCFWHAHAGCARAGTPKTRQTFWEAKLERNRRRDEEAATALRATGWDVLTISECEVEADVETALMSVVSFLGPPGRGSRRHSGADVP